MHAMNGKNHLYVQMNQLSLRNKLLKVKTFKTKIYQTFLEDSMEYTSI